MKSSEAFQALLGHILFRARRFKNIPGDVVGNMSQEIRRALSELRSDEIGNNLRFEPYELGDDQFYQKKTEREERMEFDKKLRM